MIDWAAVRKVAKAPVLLLLRFLERRVENWQRRLGR